MIEASFDGIVGPTHNYAGLSFGNVASKTNEGTISRPRDAVKEGLAKMKRLADLGVPQFVLPPHERPHVGALRALGFRGTDREVISEVAREEPRLLAQVSSASAMWTANAATVAPSPDTGDGRVHFTPANLASTFHRSLEPELTARVLARIFGTEAFVHHPPLPARAGYGDEGAANHTRLVRPDGRGVHVFVWGRSAFGDDAHAPPGVFPARQTLEASRAVARLHELRAEHTVFVRQASEAIDAGAFHTDVVSVGHENVLLYHEHAFADGERAVDAVDRAMGGSLVRVRIGADELGLADAVASYLFNSQIVSPPGRPMTLVAPIECEEHPRVKRAIDRVVADPACPIGDALFLDVRQSMRNGGGPACLRLRVALSDDELAAVHDGVRLDDARHAALSDWADRHYREQLAPADLADPRLLDESRNALDDLTRILEMGSVYDFQR
jgi:succinylarginine dihydrolase